MAMNKARMDENEVFRCNICGQITAWKDGAADDMPDACSKCWAKHHRLDMENNPDWAPYLEVVRKDSHDDTAAFIQNYPVPLRPSVALALSLTKWYLISIYHGREIDYTCGCCVLFVCSECPLSFVNNEEKRACIAGAPAEIYNRILRVYTPHFNALPDRYKQKAA